MNSEHRNEVPNSFGADSGQAFLNAMNSVSSASHPSMIVQAES